jgi:hypothetical protein
MRELEFTRPGICGFASLSSVIMRQGKGGIMRDEKKKTGKPEGDKKKDEVTPLDGGTESNGGGQ